MAHRIIISLLFAIYAWLNVFSQKIISVDTEYTYHAPETMSPLVAKQIALEKAQIQAITDNFKTSIDQTNITLIDNSDSNSEVTFKSYATSNLRGEWIQTTHGPTYDIINSDNMQIVRVSLSGKIREIPASRAQIDLALCNNISNPYHTTTFHNEEPVFVKCQSSQNGYVMIFLEDEEGNAIRLLPFDTEESSGYKIIENYDYAFFANKNDVIDNIKVGGEELRLTASHDNELNIITFIYSPTIIQKPIYDRINGASFESLPSMRFQKWLSESRTSNSELIVIQTPIIIKL